MRVLEGSGLANRAIGARPSGACRGPRAALLTLLVLSWLLGAAAPAGASPARDSAQALLARLAVEQTQLTAADGAVPHQFGYSVAISGDTALVGARWYGTGGKIGPGAAYVFVRSGGSWTAQAKLAPSDRAFGDHFGYAVALSGETAVIGALDHDAFGKKNAGAAYVLVRSAGFWTQQAKPIAAAGAAGDAFGGSVALFGATALVGARYHDTAGKADAGAAYVFLVAPTVASFLPASGPVGATVTLTGTGFSGATSVSFNGIAIASFSVDSDSKITATVPAGATSGLIAVTGPGGTGVSQQSFTLIPRPVLSKLTPPSGKRGAIVTITGTGTGTGFGATRGAGSVKFGSATCTRYVLWSATKITCKVPAKAKYGTVKVTAMTAGGVSNARSFEVKR